MKAFAKLKCFRRGHDFSRDWDRIINLINLSTAISFPNRQYKLFPLQCAASKNLKFDILIEFVTSVLLKARLKKTMPASTARAAAA